jgi:hypothetical protein
MLTTYHHLAPRWKINNAIHLIHVCVFMMWTGKTSPFTLIFLILSLWLWIFFTRQSSGLANFYTSRVTPAIFSFFFFFLLLIQVNDTVMTQAVSHRFSSRKSSVNPRPFLVGFVADKMVTGQVHLRELKFFPSHYFLFTARFSVLHHPLYVISEIDSVVK